METIVTAKGFVNKQGDKVQMIPAQHEHTIQEVDGLQAALDGKAPSQHSHAMSDISGLQGFLGSKANQVQNGTDGNLAGLDSRGDLTDSGYKPGDFALAGHSHSAIVDASTESSISIDEGIISIAIEGEGSGGETEINANNIGNLHRALATPSSIPEDDATKLITSKAVYDALLWKMADKSIDSTPADHADNLISSKAVYDALALKADATVVNEKIGYTQYGLVILKDTTDSTYPITDEHLQGDVSDFVLHVPVGKVVVCQISYGTQLSQLNNALCLARWSEATGSNVFIEVYLGSSLFVALLPYSGEHVIDFTSAAWTKVDLSSF